MNKFKCSICGFRFKQIMISQYVHDAILTMLKNYGMVDNVGISV